MKSCRSHSPPLSQIGQSSGWLMSRNSSVPWRPFFTFGVSVRTTMPSRHRRGAGGGQLGHPLDLDEAHAAGAERVHLAGGSSRSAPRCPAAAPPPRSPRPSATLHRAPVDCQVDQFLLLSHRALHLLCQRSRSEGVARGTCSAHTAVSASTLAMRAGADEATVGAHVVDVLVAEQPDAADDAAW